MQKIYEHDMYIGVYSTDLVGVILYDAQSGKKSKHQTLCKMIVGADLIC